MQWSFAAAGASPNRSREKAAMKRGLMTICIAVLAVSGALAQQKKSVPPPPKPKDEGSGTKAAPIPTGGISFATINVRQAVASTKEGRQRLAALSNEAAQQTEAEAKQKVIFSEVLQKMAPDIVKYAGNHGYGMLLDTSNPWPESNLLWYAPSVDATKGMVDAYDGASLVTGPAAANGTSFAVINIQQAVFGTNEGQQRSAALRSDSAQQADAEAKQKAIFQDIFYRMQAGIVKYAGDRGYGMVVDVSNPWPASNVLWFSPSVDITKAIVDGYNSPSQVIAQIAPSGTRFAVINIQGAVFGSKEGKGEAEALTKRMEPTQKDLESQNDQLKGLQQQLQSQGDKLTDDARVTLVKQIETKKASLERAVQEFQANGQNQAREIFQRILAKMAPSVIRYATDHGYAMILDTSQSWPQSSLLWAAEGVDVTKAIIEGYDQSGCDPLDQVVQIEDARPSGSGHCEGESDFWFKNASKEAIDCAIIFHKNGRFDPASVLNFSLQPGERSGGTGKISTCGADSGEMQYQCFAHSKYAAANSCTAQIQWK
jgi:Skp family chaperone for outer membrane proteins